MNCPSISIIIPVLNEAPLVTHALFALSGLRARGCEVIVVDGGSNDGTLDAAKNSGLADAVISCERGRARQMNDGARVARGGLLLFLHADTCLPPDASSVLIATLCAGNPASSCRRRVWGRFDVRIEGRHWILPLVARCMNLRSRLSGIVTGDQALFVMRDLFERCGGYPVQPLMEDIALSRILKRHSAPVCLRATVVTSGRRWERHGALRTILLMWRLRLAYFFGVSPEHLARRYQRHGHD